MSSAGTSHHPQQLTKVFARDLSKLFGATPALRGASVELNSGEISLITGPNGSGKSTLLNILGTQLRPSRGQVEYVADNGSRLTRLEVRAQLGWVSHASHCYAELTGRQNVELVAELQGVALCEYGPIADRMGLGRFAERPMGTLSRGQSQRVAIARALIHKPSLLLLDEPWTGLDRKSGELLENVIREEQTRGALVAIVSHEEGLGQRLNAREIQVLRGRIQKN